MLRKENKFMLGTIEEVAKKLYKTNAEDFRDRFIESDFAVANLDFSDEDLETIANNSTGWYGIKKLKTGFDCYKDFVDLFADYYGGGCGVYRLVEDYGNDKDIIDTIKEMIIETLSHQEGNIIDNHIIICELK